MSGVGGLADIRNDVPSCASAKAVAGVSLAGDRRLASGDKDESKVCYLGVMLNWLEQFSAANHHTVAALEAFSTFAAVVVSLGLALVARRSIRTRIKAYATVSVMHHSLLEGKPKLKYVTITIRNLSQLPVSILFAFFHWKVPFKRDTWFINPWDYSQHDPWVPQRIYPAEIKSRGSEIFFLSEIATFRSATADVLADVRHFRWRIRFMKALVITDDRKIFKVKLDKTVRHELAAIRRTAAALNSTAL
jgi:hypothetical protein